MGKGPNSIPDRWLDYKPIGEAIEGTRFISFKVPLKQHLHETNQIPEDQAFTPSNLFETLGEKNHQLGLLIDLTFTRRYYDSEEITSNDVRYEKVFTAGHHIPDRSVVDRFTQVVKEFEENNADNDHLIGVHCTHGVNRTGYLICRYMIEHLKFTPDDALKAYEKARGYPVERENYVADLRTRPRSDEPNDEPKHAWDSHRQPYHGRSNDWSNDYNPQRRRPDGRRYQPYSNRWKDNHYGNDYYQDNNDRYSRSHAGNYQSNYRSNDYHYQEGYSADYYATGQNWDQGRIRSSDDRSADYYSQNSRDNYSDTRRRGTASINNGRQFYGQSWDEQYPNKRHQSKWTKKTY